MKLLILLGVIIGLVHLFVIGDASKHSVGHNYDYGMLFRLNYLVDEPQ